MRILIVEDDFISRVLLKKMLAQYGNCDVAVNGLEAVNAFQMAAEENNPYELICLDIMMPELDGKEALKIIREKEKQMKIPPSSEAKIIMTTALDTPKDVIEAYYSGGCTAYLVKPIEKQHVRKVLMELGLIE